MPNSFNNTMANIVTSNPVSTVFTVGSAGGSSNGLYTGANGTSASQFVMSNNGVSASTWNNSITATGAITAPDFVMDGISLKENFAKINERLAILVPDPNKLEKFAALKAAYEHYKLLEKLCTEP